MKCETIFDDLQAFLDNELQAARRGEIELHLSECSECQDLVGDLRGVSRMMQNWDVPTPNLPTGQQLLARAAAQRNPLTRFLNWFSSIPMRVKVPVFATAAALMFGVFLFNNTAYRSVLVMAPQEKTSSPVSQAQEEAARYPASAQPPAAQPTVGNVADSKPADELSRQPQRIQDQVKAPAEASGNNKSLDEGERKVEASKDQPANSRNFVDFDSNRDKLPGGQPAQPLGQHFAEPEKKNAPATPSTEQPKAIARENEEAQGVKQEERAKRNDAPAVGSVAAEPAPAPQPPSKTMPAPAMEPTTTAKGPSRANPDSFDRSGRRRSESRELEIPTAKQDDGIGSPEVVEVQPPAKKKESAGGKSMGAPAPRPGLTASSNTQPQRPILQTRPPVLMATPVQRLIVKTGRLFVEVDNFGDAKDRVINHINNRGASIQSEKQEAEDGKKIARYTLRVPAENFAALLGDFRNLGKVTNESSEEKDKADQYRQLGEKISIEVQKEQRLAQLILDDKKEKDSTLAKMQVQKEQNESITRRTQLQNEMQRLLEESKRGTITLVISEKKN